MMWSRLVIVLASLSTWLCVQAKGNNCHKYVLVSLRGTGEPQGPSESFAGMIKKTLAAIPGGVEYPLPYPASSDLQVSTAEGGVNLTKYIDFCTKLCPDQQYVLLGYSQGAGAASLGVAKYKPDTAQYRAIKGILVVGNPGHKPFQSANVDQHGGSRTQGYLGAFYNLGLRFPRFWYESTKIFDICYTQDIICAPDYVNSSFDAHVKYGKDKHVQNMGSVFMRSVLTPGLSGD